MYNSLVGIPWRERGRDRRGIDCYGCVALAFRELFDLALPTYTEASPADVDEVARMISENAREPWVRVAPEHQRLGDVALFRQEAALPTHVGLVIRPYVMLHIRRGGFSELSSFGADDWRGRIWAARLAAIYRHEALV